MVVEADAEGFKERELVPVLPVVIDRGRWLVGSHADILAPRGTPGGQRCVTTSVDHCDAVCSIELSVLSGRDVLALEPNALARAEQAVAVHHHRGEVGEYV
jgi:hypothetical protein